MVLDSMLSRGWLNGIMREERGVMAAKRVLERILMHDDCLLQYKTWPVNVCFYLRGRLSCLIFSSWRYNSSNVIFFSVTGGEVML